MSREFLASAVLTRRAADHSINCSNGVRSRSLATLWRQRSHSGCVQTPQRRALPRLTPGVPRGLGLSSRLADLTSCRSLLLFLQLHLGRLWLLLALPPAPVSAVRTRPWGRLLPVCRRHAPGAPCGTGPTSRPGSRNGPWSFQKLTLQRYTHTVKAIRCLRDCRVVTALARTAGSRGACVSCFLLLRLEQTTRLPHYVIAVCRWRRRLRRCWRRRRRPGGTPPAAWLNSHPRTSHCPHWRPGCRCAPRMGDVPGSQKFSICPMKT